MDSNEGIAQKQQEATVPENLETSSLSGNGGPVVIRSDLDFIESLRSRCGDFFMKCMQCGTCSATCMIAPDLAPFPGKEMAWASWGLRDRLLKDPDVWLCYQCNDCSTRCPRGARPGDLLAAVRQESIVQHAFPRFLSRWVNQPQAVPLLLSIPIILLSLALILREPVEKALGITRPVGDEILYSYSSIFPHWLLNNFFLFFTGLVIIAVIVGVVSFWGSMKAFVPAGRDITPVKGLMPSILSALKNVITHENFSKCTAERTRQFSHICIFFGFIALSCVTLWVMTLGINPLISGNFIYPFGFWSPWKILANLGGLALLVGIGLIIRDRMRHDEQAGAGNYYDWAFLATIFAVVATGFFTEILHYVRLEPHRHIAYFVHLVFVFALIVYLPYSKFAHIIYRTVAMVYAEYTGRNNGTSSNEGGK
ncbi:MAG: hypothetical protein DRP51_03425 [Candidatus Zixiibacteriota bacterium]|nr:MAG: hypothetical protein DRP51_03425 [candidate division Zixibacteria bacterium]